MTLAVDDYGNVLKSAAIGYQRRVPAFDEQQTDSRDAHGEPIHERRSRRQRLPHASSGRGQDLRINRAHSWRPRALPGGARWISCRKGFFLPVAVLSCLFRRLFLEYLTAAFDAGKLKFFHTLEPLWERRAFLRTLAPLWNAKWVVHAKRPFAGPEQVLDYVGR